MAHPLAVGPHPLRPGHDVAVLFEVELVEPFAHGVLPGFQFNLKG